MEKNRPALTVLRVLAAFAAWFAIYKCYGFFLDPLLEDVLPEIIRMVLSRMIVPYTLGIGASYLILKGMPSGKDSLGNAPVSAGLIAKGFGVQMGYSMPLIVIVNIFCIILGCGGSGITADQIFGKYELFYLILLIGFAPVVEELVFRKLFLDKLLAIGITPAIVISAMIFGLPHVISQGVPQMFGTFAIGLVWAYLRVKTGKLWPSMILHALFNLYGSYFTLTAVSLPFGTPLVMLLNIIIFPTLAVIFTIKEFSKKHVTAVA